MFTNSGQGCHKSDEIDGDISANIIKLPKGPTFKMYTAEVEDM